MKTDVYSWRLDSELKTSLEDAARSRGSSLARLLDEIARDWLGSEIRDEDDEGAQRRLHAKARKAFGTLERGDQHLAEQAGPRVREKLRQRHAARRAG